MKHLSIDELTAGLPGIRQSPLDAGTVDLIVRRPAVGEREIIEEAELDPDHGLIGDRWGVRRHGKDMQLTIMNSRAIALIAQQKERWALAGDQFFVDLSLAGDNLPPGTRLRLGNALIEITDVPHTGCGKFVSRFGVDATKFVNSPAGRELGLRGINARIIEPGTVRVGGRIAKI
jgi:MOSC domain-containing protein YiiM